MKAALEVRKLEKTYETKLERRERDLEMTRKEIAAKQKEMTACQAIIEDLKSQHIKDLEPLRIQDDHCSFELLKEK
jgi:hypothetical protein